MALGTVTVGTGTVGTRYISKDYPQDRGLTAGTTVHLIDAKDYDDEDN
jgi:hypothetical protein